MCVQAVPEWTVESASVVMFQYLVRKNGLSGPLEREGIRAEELKFIESLMDPRVAPPDEKKFLRNLVRDPSTSIDAETMDSIARDSYHLNVPCNFDHKRLVKFVRLNVKEDGIVLCYRDKEAHDLYSMFESRLSLQTRAYKHKTVQLIEWMMEQVLKRANEAMGFTAIARDLLCDDKERRFEAAEKYTRLTDCVTDRILESNEPSLRESQEILRDIQHRKLKKLIGTVHTDSSSGELEQFKNEAYEQDILTTCRILPVEYYFGTKDCENPVDEVFFYSKLDTSCPFNLKKEQVSRILPERFTDFALRVFHDRADIETYKRVEREFKSLLKAKRNLKWVTGFTPYAYPTGGMDEGSAAQP
jgi:HD superfamily phosphohydrolase